MNNPSLDLGSALTFMFEEEDWLTKFLIAAAMVLFGWLILPALLLQGYGIEVIRRVGRGATPALPEWGEWGRYLSDGLVALVAFMVYTLPAILFVCCASIPLLAASDSTSGELEGTIFLILCCMALGLFLIQFPLWGLYPAGSIHFAARGGIGSFFSAGMLTYVRRQPGQYFYALLILFFAGFVGGLVPIVGAAWSQLATSHTLGQLLRRGDSASADIASPEIAL